MGTQTPSPTVTRAGQGEARWWFDSLAEILPTREATAGALSIVRVVERPGARAPLHLHHHDDETFIVVEGGATLEVGGRTIPVAAGDVAFGPRAIPHRYDVGPEGCTMLFVLTPGGRFDEMVRSMSRPAGSRTLPPPTLPTPDLERVAELARAHGNELLAAPPED